MAKSHKKHHPEEHSEGWIVSFADLMCLMMSFFVIMAAGNPKDVRMDPEFAEIVAAIKQAFNHIPPADSTDPVDIQILLNQLKSQKGRGGAGKRGDAWDDNDGAVGRYDQVQTVRTGTQTTIGGQIPFDRSSADVNYEASLMLTQVAYRMKGHTNIFVIKGHCSRDEEQELAGTGRDLGYERALAAAAKLQALGLNRQSLRVQSCSDYEPLKEGAYSETELAANRRVEIIATESLITEVRGQSAAAPKAEAAAHKADPDDEKADAAADTGAPADKAKAADSGPPADKVEAAADSGGSGGETGTAESHATAAIIPLGR